MVMYDYNNFLCCIMVCVVSGGISTRTSMHGCLLTRGYMDHKGIGADNSMHRISHYFLLSFIRGSNVHTWIHDASVFGLPNHCCCLAIIKA